MARVSGRQLVLVATAFAAGLICPRPNAAPPVTYRVKVHNADGRLVREIVNSPRPMVWESVGRIVVFPRDGSQERVTGFAFATCQPEGFGTEHYAGAAGTDYP